MSKREIRWLIALAVVLMVVVVGVFTLVNIQQNADRAGADEQHLIETRNANFESTATAQATP